MRYTGRGCASKQVQLWKCATGGTFKAAAVSARAPERSRTPALERKQGSAFPEPCSDDELFEKSYEANKSAAGQAAVSSTWISKTRISSPPMGSVIGCPHSVQGTSLAVPSKSAP